MGDCGRLASRLTIYGSQQLRIVQFGECLLLASAHYLVRVWVPITLSRLLTWCLLLGEGGRGVLK